MADSTLTVPETEDIVGRRVSPAQHLHDRFERATVTGSRGVRLSERPFLTMVGLRVRPGSATRGDVESRLGVRLPSRCGAVSDRGDLAVLWLSPDEFLLVSEERSGDELVQDLSRLVEGTADAVVDLSANRTTFVLAGASARQLLAKGCPLDLHPRTFAPGTAVTTSIGRVQVILHQVADDAYRIHPRASFADHLGRWLVDAMAEFRVPEPQ